ncbi:MAG: YlxR family protein [Actinobacteria bacterium]|nr:YlxR family protein [Actinomycetota bacterium]
MIRSEPPVRTCTGCGRKAPQEELLRFVADGSELRSSPRGPGRGAYTCRRLACFERAVARRAFARTLRRAVHVDPALARLYTRTR